MKESSTYQMILREGREEGLKIGREEGRNEGRRNDVRSILRARFGLVPVALDAQLQATTDPVVLEAAVVAAATAATVEDVTL